MVKRQVVVSSSEGNRITGGHPVANQGVARMDKQNKQVAAAQSFITSDQQRWY